MKKLIGHSIGYVVELLFIAGAYVIQYFTGKKMGMARFVIFKNQSWEKQYPLEQWTWISILLLAVLLMLTVVLMVCRRKRLSALNRADGVLAVALTGYSLYFTVANSAATLRPYYWMSPLIAAAALIQLLKSVYFLLKKDRISDRV